MKKTSLILQAIFVLILCVTCQKEIIESQDYPRIRTLKVSRITADGATFNAEILSKGTNPIIEYGFLWDIEPNLDYHSSEKVSFYDPIGKGSFSYRSEPSLTKDQEYFVQSFAITDDFIVYGNTVQFVSSGSMSPEIKAFYPGIASYAYFGDSDKYNIAKNEW
ncbi:hypothetical protein [Natronoflexus pectinivorans]|uniref:Uncharacterized protein n=1 Tax=Natronoflexus pectinivorans TaxID=682526 RepID=A0A4R2GIQ9_9BACT|nr:hypothetical protein [Natronoflexus pectinivorans]TCO08408.1 hypothetical protein EV194_105213 [Natronoflexus pectinivorans]